MITILNEFHTLQKAEETKLLQEILQHMEEELILVGFDSWMLRMVERIRDL